MRYLQKLGIIPSDVNPVQGPQNVKPEHELLAKLQKEIIESDTAQFEKSVEIAHKLGVNLNKSINNSKIQFE